MFVHLEVMFVRCESSFCARKGSPGSSLRVNQEGKREVAQLLSPRVRHRNLERESISLGFPCQQIVASQALAALAELSVPLDVFISTPTR